MTRSNAKFWSAMEPIGDPNGGPLCGQLEDFITPTMIATSLLGAASSTILGGLFCGDKGSAAPAPTPVVAPPTPMATPPELDPKQKAMQEQSILMSGNSPSLSRSGTILGGSGTLG